MQCRFQTVEKGKQMNVSYLELLNAIERLSDLSELSGFMTGKWTIDPNSDMPELREKARAKKAAQTALVTSLLAEIFERD